MKSLGDLVTILKGRKAPEVYTDPQPGAERYLQIDDLRGMAMPRFARDPKGVLANRGDVLLAWDGANAGTVGFGLEGYAGSTIAILRPQSKNVYGPFLGYFLHGKFDYIQKHCTGATIPHVNRRTLEEMELELPPLLEQKRIAAVLAKADRLRRLRRYALDLSDTYLQSVFLEMFGDPVVNPMGWKDKLVDDVCDLVRGSSPRPQGDPKFFGGPVPRLMIADITRDGMWVTPMTDSLTEEGAKRSRPMKAGSVVMAVSGAVGLPAILKIDACIHDGFVGFRALDADVLPVYFAYLLATLRRSSQSQATGAIWQNLTTDQIKLWRVPCPPLVVQERFFRIVRRLERLRAQQREAERQAQHLFQTLLHQAFQGEL